MRGHPTKQQQQNPPQPHGIYPPPYNQNNTTHSQNNTPAWHDAPPHGPTPQYGSCMPPSTNMTSPFPLSNTPIYHSYLHTRENYLPYRSQQQGLYDLPKPPPHLPKAPQNPPSTTLPPNIPPPNTLPPNSVREDQLNNKANLDRMREDRKLVFQKAAKDLEKVKQTSGSTTAPQTGWEQAWKELERNMTKM